MQRQGGGVRLEATQLGCLSLASGKALGRVGREARTGQGSQEGAYLRH